MSSPSLAFERIAKRHRLDAKQVPNGKKQAAQLSFCLRQALSYLRAARAVTEETRPVLLYYACCSLASAQVLWLGTGEHSLDKLRASHASHGLTRHLDLSSRDTTDWLTKVRAELTPSGLFAVWRGLSSEDSIAGMAETRKQRMSTSGLEAIFLGEETLASPPDTAIFSLLEVVRCIPGLAEPLHSLGIEPRIVRATASRVRVEIGHPDKWTETVTVIVHPGPRALIDEVMGHVKYPAEAVNRLDIHEAASGFSVKETTRMFSQDNATCGCNRSRIESHWPSGISATKAVVYFRSDLRWLNEFGMYFAGLYILGMVARYYPDKWMALVDGRSPCAYIADEFCRIAETRMTLCTAGILENRMYVYQD